MKLLRKNGMNNAVTPMIVPAYECCCRYESTCFSTISFELTAKNSKCRKSSILIFVLFNPCEINETCFYIDMCQTSF